MGAKNVVTHCKIMHYSHSKAFNPNLMRAHALYGSKWVLKMRLCFGSNLRIYYICHAVRSITKLCWGATSPGIEPSNMHNAVLGGVINLRLPFHYAIWHMPRKPHPSSAFGSRLSFPDGYAGSSSCR